MGGAGTEGLAITKQRRTILQGVNMLRHCSRRFAAHALAGQAACAALNAWVPCCGAVTLQQSRDSDSGANTLRAVPPPWRLPCRGFATQPAEHPFSQGTEEVHRRRVSQADTVLRVRLCSFLWTYQRFEI